MSDKAKCRNCGRENPEHSVDDFCVDDRGRLWDTKWDPYPDPKLVRMAEIEKELALSCAKADIGSWCLGHYVKGKQWFESELPANEPLRETIQAEVNRAIEYLEHRGLLERQARRVQA